jgi:hypothetical protein
MSWMRDAVEGFKKYNEKKKLKKEFNPLWALYALLGIIVVLTVVDAIIN